MIKKFISLFSVSLIMFLNCICISATVSMPSYNDNVPGSAPYSEYWEVGESNEYIFVRKTINDDTFKFKQSGLYTNDDKKELIYSLPDFGDETVYISEDGFTVMTEAGTYFGYNYLSQSLFVLYKYGKKVKEYKLSSIYNFPLEMHGTSNGYIWENFVDNDYDYGYDYENDIRYFETLNGRKVTINTLTGEMTKTPSYYEKKILPFIIVISLILIATIVLIIIKKRKKKTHLL